VIGLGSRAEMWVRGLVARGALAAFCDTSAHRMAVHNAWLAEPAPTYQPDEFAAMVAEQDIDTVAVCTPDWTHARYVIAALAAGLDVVVEKPLATTYADLRDIARAERASRGTVRVAFNYRYNPAHSEVRRLLAAGTIGDIGSVHFEWCLDTHHGADYFRRWHRERSRSGGLLVHKSAHHFDLVGWWLDADPVRVAAEGRRVCYGADGALAGDDRFALDIGSVPRLAALYADPDDGYRRDGDVFDPSIDIEDDLAVLVRWSNGASMSYHLNAYAPGEGYRVAVNGTAGRLELDVVESDWARPDPGAAAARLSGSPGGAPMRWRITVRPQWSEPYEVEVPAETGAHGGGDERLLADLLDERGDDPVGRAAGLADGVRAVVTGLAANESIAEQRTVDAAARLADILDATPVRET
jgi:predicted dehydrogenase